MGSILIQISRRGKKPHEHKNFSTTKTPKKILKKTFLALSHLKPNEGEIIDHAVAVRNALILMPTGGNKSLFF
jgi:superfamily II DNA helicase RecQ